MLLTINSEQRDSSAANIAELIKDLKIDATFFAVAVNGTVVPSGSYGSHKLEEGDRVEIVTPIGGG